MSALTDFLSVQVPNEKLIREHLHIAADEATKVIKKTSVNPHSSAANVRIAQYRLAISEIRSILREMWSDDVSPTIAAGIKEAGGEAGSLKVLSDTQIGDLGFNRRSWEAANREVARNNVTAYRQRVEGSSYVPLSSRVYRNTALSNGLVDRAVNTALLLGKSAKELAKDVASLISPDVPGGISYSALRLGRTELNNAFHSSTIEHHGKAPWTKSFTWNLSGSHRRPDECDNLVGSYSVEDTPSKPHPQCFCYITPDVVSQRSFERNFKSGKYDKYLDDMIAAGV